MSDHRRVGATLVMAAAALMVVVSCAPDAPDAMRPASDVDADVEMAVTTTIATVPPNGDSVTIQVLDNSFRPAEWTVEAGTEVVFENRGRNDHNILPPSVENDVGLSSFLGDGSDPTRWGVASSEFTPGDSYRVVLGAPGVYDFYCSIHGSSSGGMIGSITVE
ncbi:MAG: plastocyanin/azurin family copper-binding protein [Ilumatobacteraceae bacterium]